MDVAAVVFDLDGVLVDSEQRWDAAREALVRERGGRWAESATRAMMGMSSPEWSAYLRDELGVDMEPAEIAREVGERMLAGYREDLPLLPGADEAVRRLGERWPLGMASSSNREVIDAVIEQTGWRFGAVVSSEEVERGKPAPDVYLEAARRIGVDPRHCVAVEDSSNGLRAAHAAGMIVIATPNHAFPPAPDALALAAVVVDGIRDVTPELVASLTTG